MGQGKQEGPGMRETGISDEAKTTRKALADDLRQLAGFVERGEVETVLALGMERGVVRHRTMVVSADSAYGMLGATEILVDQIKASCHQLEAIDTAVREQQAAEMDAKEKQGQYRH